jgi:uncharacterized membrane protein SpoIIM required for sporulation
MKETAFIRQNSQKWADFERTLADPNRDPDRLHDLYIQITDDLSHARTFYPTRSVRAYLNSLGQLIFGDIYKQKKSPLSKIAYFFTDELPQVIYESRWSFFWAIAFFLLSFIIGYFSSMMDERFLKIILGDEYVRMTVENIKKHDPMAVYKSSGRVDMTFGIMANNIRVTLFYFISGVFAGIGSVAMMMYNGIMLGSFLQFFTRYNLAGEANLAVWMHGTLEISAIVIGTAAGITMGRGLLFPGTYTRLQAFQMSARRGIKIMVGVLVMLVFAALIEGNLTRHTELGAARGVFIAANVAAILFYYGWLPFYKARKGFDRPLGQAQLPPDNFYKFQFDKIKSAGEIFGDTFLFFSRNISTYFPTCAILSAFFCLLTFATTKSELGSTFKLQAEFFSSNSAYRFFSFFFDQFSVIKQFFHNENLPFLPILNAGIYAGLAFTIFKKILKQEGSYQQTKGDEYKSLGELVLLFGIWSYSASMTGGIWLFFLMSIVLPWFVMNSFLMMRYGFNFNYLKSFKHTAWLISSNRELFFSVIGLQVVVSWLLFSFLNSSLTYFYMWMIGWNFSFYNESQLDAGVAVAMTFIAAFLLFLIMALFFTAMSFAFYSLLEINEANSLIQRIQQIGMGRKIRGMVRE